MFSIPARIAVVLLLVLGLTLTAPAADPPAKPPTKEQIAEWVKGLASDSFDEREAASKALWKAGQPAEAPLRQVLKEGDAEAVRRAREILDKFDWGLYPDTPAAIVTLIEQYRSDDPEARSKAIGKLLDQGGAGYAALMKLAGMEKDAAAKKLIWDLLTADIPRLAGALLAEGEESRLEEVLQQALTGEGDLPHANYAAYYLVRGKLDDKLRDLQKKAGANPDKKTALTLAYLCRAKGDLAGARKYAEKAEHSALLRTILVEQEDWKALLNHLDQAPRPEDGTSPAGLRLVCLRLLGDRDGFTTELTKVRDDTEGRTLLAMFLLNGRIDDAMTWLTKTNNDTAAAELLAARLRFREAFDRAEKGKPDDMIPRLFLARQLGQLGERKKARDVLDKLVAETKADPNGSLAEIIIGAEIGAGFKDEAFARAADLLSKGEFKDRAGLLNQLFLLDDIDTSVEPWWTFLHQKYPKDDNAATLKRMRDLFDRKLPRKDTADWLKEMADESANLKAEEREPWLHCVADACRALGRDDLAEVYLEKWAAAGGNANALLQLGDLAAGGKRWKDAAARYKRAWDKDRGNALALYLYGHSFVQSGQEKEGRRWIEAAELLPLGNDDKRSTLAAGLIYRGLEEAGGKEWERLGRLILLSSSDATLAARGLAEHAAKSRDFTKAAACARRENLLALTQPGYEYPEGLLWLYSAEHRYRARALAAVGKLDEMNKEIDAILAVEPDIDLAIDLVAELTKQGKKKDADELFNRIYAAHDAVCKEFPKSGREHNNTAWLAVRCKRNLDAALEHARHGVEFEPDTAGHLDTLAEVHFQRGDKDKAVELAKKCIEMQPKNSYFRNQLKRMQAGDRDAELPREPSPTAGIVYRGVAIAP